MKLFSVMSEAVWDWGILKDVCEAVNPITQQTAGVYKFSMNQSLDLFL